MALNFEQSDDTVEAAMRRIACAEIDRALAAIDDPARTIEQTIHALRQQCKKLRALLRLVRPAFAGFDTMNALFRDIAGNLSGARDAKVLVDTLDMLVESGKDELANLDTAAIRARLSAALDATSDQDAIIAAGRARLVEARTHAARWTLTADGWDAISGGLEKSYRRARKAMKAAKAHPNPELSHAWRKHVKHHGQHLRLLRPIKPDFLHKRVKKVGQLAETLGQRHDIDVFMAAIGDKGQHTVKKDEIEVIGAIATRCRTRLDTQAQADGTELFRRKPHKLATRWEDWWQEWRDAGDREQKG